MEVEVEVVELVDVDDVDVEVVEVVEVDVEVEEVVDVEVEDVDVEDVDVDVRCMLDDGRLLLLLYFLYRSGAVLVGSY